MKPEIESNSDAIHFDKMKSSPTIKTLTQALMETMPYDVPEEAIDGDTKIQIDIKVNIL